MPKDTFWTIEKIKAGFEKFYSINNRYPTAYDIDDFEYLPSSRQIQRSFGGLVNLRKILGLHIRNYSKGKNRKIIANSSNTNSRKAEIKVYNLLKEKFKDEFIHIERPVLINGIGKDRYDFYVFAKPSNFAIDVFCTEGDARSLIKIMNIKENKYRKTNDNVILYFVYFGDKVQKNKIAGWLDNRCQKFPSNWLILSFNEFQIELDRYKPYEIS
jgi:hypothetical protein